MPERVQKLRALVESMVKSGAKVPKKMLEELKGMEMGIVRHELLTWVNADMTEVVDAVRPPEEGAWQPAAHMFEEGVLNEDNPHGFTKQDLFFCEWVLSDLLKDGPFARFAGRHLLSRIGVKPVPQEGYKVWLRDDDAPGQYAEWTFPFKYVTPVHPHAATVLLRSPPESNIEPCLVRVGDKIGFATAYHSDGTYAVRFDSDNDVVQAIPWWRVESYERREIQAGFICRVWEKREPPRDPRRRLDGHFVNRVHKAAGGGVRVQMMETSLVNPCKALYTYDEGVMYEVPCALRDMCTVEDMFSVEPTKPYLFRSMFAYLFVQDAFLGSKFISNVFGIIQKFRDELKQEWRPVVRQELLFRVRVLAEKDDDWWDVHTGRCVEIFRDPNEETTHTVPDLHRAVRAVRGFCAAIHAVRSHMEEFCKMDDDQLRVQHRNLRDTMILTHRGRVGEFWDNMIALHGDAPLVVEAATTLGYLEPALPEVNPFEREGSFDDQVPQGTKSGNKKKRKKRKKHKKKKKKK